jgi:hypothetical protein
MLFSNSSIFFLLCLLTSFMPQMSSCKSCNWYLNEAHLSEVLMCYFRNLWFSTSFSQASISSFVYLSPSLGNTSFSLVSIKW